MKIQNLIVFTLLFCSACSTAASLKMKDGSAIDGEILGGNDTEIIVRSDDLSKQTIKRSDIEDIDHPGNVTLVAGSALTVTGAASVGFGIAALISAAEQREAAEGTTGLSAGLAGFFADYTDFFGYLLLGGGIGLLGGGVPMIVWGHDTWTDSKDGAEVQGIDAVEISVGNGLGLSLKASF